MAITPEELSKRLDKAIQEVNKQLPNIVDALALDQKQLFRARVTQKGLNVDSSGNEVEFPSYSDGYKKFKAKKQGSSTPNRLVLSGAMLRDYNIIKRSFVNGIYVVTLGGTNQDSQDKLNWNEERYGDILKPSNEETKELNRIFGEEVINVIIEQLK
jgi:hypothetical protein